MAIFKCKMCGGNIQVIEHSGVGTCESCGTISTLPKESDEQIANLFNRANHYRRQGDFDKALAAYESILGEDNTNAEAHWCAVLCRYGIEYVEDPSTRNRVPTCRRVQFKSILSDPDYLAAIEYSQDEYIRSIYEEEAAKISEIQKNILVISNKEDPYDIFICYKETTEGGSRTKDSVIAQDIYHHLTKDGYRVFFSRITLEDKLGQQYESYIFNALNSAKIMLVIGTCKENFEATWVKNEWSRFLALMKEPTSKFLIPCYRDMDAYDIPDELSVFQSQDMSNVGFIQDILHGIKKILDKRDEKAALVADASIAAISAPGIESLMKRGHMFLEDEEWRQADEYFDRVLDIEPEYAPAYIGKLCAELYYKNESELSCHPEPLGNSLYAKALKFSGESYLLNLEKYKQQFQYSISKGKRKVIKARANIADYQGLITVWAGKLIALKDDGCIISERLGYSPFDKGEQELEKKCAEISDWTEIVSIHAYGGKIVGVKQSGSLIGIDIEDLNYYKFTVERAEIKFLSVSIGEAGIFALTSDGKVMHVEKFPGNHIDVSEVQSWVGIKKISTGYDFIAGLKENGSVVVSNEFDTSAVCDIVDIAADNAKSTVFCLKDDGTVISIGREGNKTLDEMNVIAFPTGNFSSGRIYDNLQRRLKDAEKISAIEHVLTTERRIHGIGRGNFIALACGVIKYSYHNGKYDLLGSYGTATVYVGLERGGTVSTYYFGDGEKFKSFPWKSIGKPSVQAIESKEESLVKTKLLLNTERRYISISGHGHEWSAFALNEFGRIIALGFCSDSEDRDKYHNIHRKYFITTIEGWTGIKAFSCYDDHAAAVRLDGTVVSVGNNKKEQCETKYWEDIVDVACAYDLTVGIKSDGTLVTAGGNYRLAEIKNWRNVNTFVANSNRAACITRSGKVIATHPGNYREVTPFERDDIISISLGNSELFAVASNGTLISDGKTVFSENWRDIVSVAACYSFVAALKSDGTVVVQALEDRWGLPDVKNWTDIVSIFCGGPGIIIGVKSNGDTVSAHDVENWKSILNIPGLKQRKYVKPNLVMTSNIRSINREFLEQEKTREEQEKIKVARRKNKLCVECGGELSPFLKKCKSCGTYNLFI